MAINYHLPFSDRSDLNFKISVPGSILNNLHIWRDDLRSLLDEPTGFEEFLVSLVREGCQKNM